MTIENIINWVGEKLSGLWNNFYFRTLTYLTLSTTLFILLVFLLLNSYTRHNSEIVVPDFAGLTVEMAQELALENELNVILSDSTEIPSAVRGSIVGQHPLSGSNVKKDRKIFVTIRPFARKKEQIPYVVGMSLTDAKNALEEEGFEIGRLHYKYDFATNQVQEQRYKNRIVTRSTKPIYVGEKIDLILSNPNAAALLNVPKVTGETFKEAKSRINSSSLNVGKVVYKGSPKNSVDSSNCKVIKQNPPYSKESKLLYGGEVSLVLQMEKKADKED